MLILCWFYAHITYNINFGVSREDELVERAKALKVNAGTDPSADIGPVISKEVLSKSEI